MKLQKIILCVAVSLTAFGASLGLLEIGNYLRTAFQPSKVEIKPPEPFAPIVYAPERIPEIKPPVAEADPAIEPAEEPFDYGESGDYYIIGKNPKGFADFENLAITTHDYSEKLEKAVRIKPTGSLVMKKEFKFSWINITNKRISFVTQTRKGISYQFDGKFIEEVEVKLKDDNGEEYTDYVVLKGRLTKWRNGIKIAEAKVRFALSHGC